MSVSAINPVSSSMAQTGAVSGVLPKKAAAPESARPSAQAQSSPAATVQLSGVPSNVDADDRALYAQILKSSGNAGSAMGAVKAQDTREGES
jgi:hypothetical protein